MLLEPLLITSMMRETQTWRAWGRVLLVQLRVLSPPKDPYAASGVPGTLDDAEPTLLDNKSETNLVGDLESPTSQYLESSGAFASIGGRASTDASSTSAASAAAALPPLALVLVLGALSTPMSIGWFAELRSVWATQSQRISHPSLPT